MDNRSYAVGGVRLSSFFYGWYIVGVGILVNIAGTFAFSSTLSIFLKPITEELGVSRGAFSLIRTFEIGVAALTCHSSVHGSTATVGAVCSSSAHSWKVPDCFCQVWCKPFGSLSWSAARWSSPAKLCWAPW